MTLLDCDGDPLVFDPSSVPNDTKIFIGIDGGKYEDGVLLEGADIIRVDNWRMWEQVRNGDLSNEYKTYTMTKECGWAFSKVLPKDGKHLIWLTFKTVSCCTTVGLVPNTHKHDSMNKFDDFNTNPHMVHCMFL